MMVKFVLLARCCHPSVVVAVLKNVGNTVADDIFLNITVQNTRNERTEK